MLNKRHLLVYLWTGIYDVVTWFFLLLLWSLWGTKLQWIGGGFWFEWKKNSWPTKTWFKGWGGTCIGHGGFLSPGESGEKGIIDTEIEFHEHFHTEQFESAMLLGFIISAAISVQCIIQGQTPNWVLLFLTWNLSSPAVVLSSMFVAFLRGKNPYKGSNLEDSAYALAEDWVQQKNNVRKKPNVARRHFK